MRLILSKIYSLFQQKTYTQKTPSCEKRLTLQKPAQISFFSKKKKKNRTLIREIKKTLIKCFMKFG